MKHKTLETDVFERLTISFKQSNISAQWRAAVEYTRSGNVPNRSSVHYCLLTIRSLLHYMHYALQAVKMSSDPAYFKMRV